MNCLDGRKTRAVAWICSHVCFWVQQHFPSRLSDVLAGIYFHLYIYGVDDFVVLGRTVLWCWVYDFWISPMAQFTNPNPSEYRYLPLTDPEHIRLLILYPRFAFEPICYSLWQGPLMSRTNYNAISYTWGANSADATECIMIDGCTKMVSRSVYELLCSQSSLLLPRILWIDALCVNQDDDKEKGQQVPRMGDIYKNAIFTTVFLGRSPMQKRKGMGFTSHSLPFRYDSLSIDESIAREFRDARLAFDFLKEVNLLCDNLGRERESLDVYHRYEELRPAQSNSPNWIAVMRLLQHSWFERVWIVQEVAKSPKVFVQYGDEEIEWDVLASGIETLYRSYGLLLWLGCIHQVKLRHMMHTSLYNVVKIQRLRKNQQWYQYNSRTPSKKAFSLARLLLEIISFKASNPRDLLYGLNSLCTDPLPVEYGLTVKEVYSTAARKLIRDGAIEFLLLNSDIGNRLESDSLSAKLPSWVINWNDVPGYERTDWNDVPGYERTNWNGITGYERTDRTLTEERNWYQARAAIEARELHWKCAAQDVLMTIGNVQDVVDQVGPIVYATQEHLSASDTMRQLARMYDEAWTFVDKHPATAEPYLGIRRGRSLRDAFHFTITHSKTEIGRGNLSRVFHDWQKNLQYFRDPEDGLSDDEDFVAYKRIRARATYKRIQAMDKVTQAIRNSCGGQRIFVTVKGYIGICPLYTARGDLVYKLYGLYLPSLMRRSSTHRLRFVGQCYYQSPASAERELGAGTVEQVEII